MKRRDFLKTSATALGVLGAKAFANSNTLSVAERQPKVQIKGKGSFGN